MRKFIWLSILKYLLLLIIGIYLIYQKSLEINPIKLYYSEFDNFLGNFISSFTPLDDGSFSFIEQVLFYKHLLPENKEALGYWPQIIAIGSIYILIGLLFNVISFDKIKANKTKGIGLFKILTLSLVSGFMLISYNPDKQQNLSQNEDDEETEIKQNHINEIPVKNNYDFDTAKKSNLKGANISIAGILASIGFIIINIIIVLISFEFDNGIAKIIPFIAIIVSIITVIWINKKSCFSANCRKIKIGMSYEDATAIMQKYNIEKKGYNRHNEYVVIYKVRGGINSDYESIALLFNEDGTLIDKERGYKRTHYQ